MQVPKSKTSWGEGGKHANLSACFLVVFGVTPFFSNRFFHSGWRWANYANNEWTGRDKAQDISCMPETNCVNIFLCLAGMFLLMSCELVIRLCDWSLRAASLSPDAYCLIHSNTHLHHTHARILLTTYSLPVQQLDLQQAAQRARRSREAGERLQIKYRWNFAWGVWGLQRCFLLLCRQKQKCGHTLIFHTEDLTHCSDRVG